MSIAFCTHCSDDWFYSGGCSKLLSSAKYFHPDIPFIVFTNLELQEIAKKYKDVSWLNLNPIVSFEVSKHYNKVIHFDADSIILGKLNELLDFTEDVACVRNNNDYDTASKFSDLPITVNNCSPERYMNAGLIGATTPKFWETWMRMNESLYRSLPYGEQDVLNLLLQSNIFKFTCLDDKTKNLHYGISCHYGKDSYWESSKDIIKKEENFMLKDKIVKVWHQAGGSRLPKVVVEEFFSPETSQEINKFVNNKIIYEKIIL